MLVDYHSSSIKFFTGWLYFFFYSFFTLLLLAVLFIDYFIVGRPGGYRYGISGIFFGLARWIRTQGGSLGFFFWFFFYLSDVIIFS